MTPGNVEVTPPTNPVPVNGNAAARFGLRTPVALILLSLFTFFVFQPVVFDWFGGDDFVHLQWLERLEKQPELLWRNFVSNWLDIPTTSFYRPLVSVSLALDYLLWKQNGIGNHITNVVLHGLCSLFLYGVVAEITNNWQEKSKQLNWHALVTATIFAIFPLHGETVCWTTGRVDSLAVMSIMLSFWAYLRYRRQDQIIWLAICLLAAAAAFASKEIAITIPVLVIAFEFLFPQLNRHINAPNPKFFEIVRASVQRAWPLFFISIIYLIVRRLALGTFVGGYNNTLLPNDWHQTLTNCQGALQRLLFPINAEAITGGNFFAKTLKLLVPTAGILLALRLVRNRSILMIAAFYALWIVISLLPVLTLFTIAPNLESSRMGYLISAPFSGLLALAALGMPAASPLSGVNILGALRRNEFFQRSSFFAIISKLFSLVFTISLIACYTEILHLNNEAWVQAGRESNNIRAAFNKLFENEQSNCTWIILNLPDTVKGAYVARNALGGLIGNAKQRVAPVDKSDTFHAQGLLKERALDQPGTVKFIVWNSQNAQFNELELAFIQPKSIVAEVSQQSLQSQRFKIELSTDSTFYVDYIVIDCRPEKVTVNPPSAVLFYETEVFGQSQVRADRIYSNGHYSFVFPLRGQPSWTFGGRCKNLSVAFIDGGNLTPFSAKVRPASGMQPKVILQSYAGNAFAQLNTTKDSFDFSVDASTLATAKGTMLELSKSNTAFSQPNSHFRNREESLKIIMLKGSINSLKIDERLVPGKGLYCLRAWAVDERGNIVGQASDHINILRTN